MSAFTRTEPLRHALVHAPGDNRDLVTRRSTPWVEDDVTVLFTAHDAIERDHMRVHEAAERCVEALDEGDAACLAARDAARVLLPARDAILEARRCGCTPTAHRDAVRAVGALRRARSGPTAARVHRAGRDRPNARRSHTFDARNTMGRTLGTCTRSRPGSPCHTSSTRRDKSRGPRCRSEGSGAARLRRSEAAASLAARALWRGRSRDARARRCGAASSPARDARRWTPRRTARWRRRQRSRQQAPTGRRPEGDGGCARLLSAVHGRPCCGSRGPVNS